MGLDSLSESERETVLRVAKRGLVGGDRVVSRHHLVSRRYPTPDVVRALGHNIVVAYWEVRGEAIDRHNEDIMRQASFKVL